MLPDTSKARMTVPSMRGTPITLCGRASATTQDVEAGDVQGRRDAPAPTSARAAAGRPARARRRTAPPELRRARRPSPLARSIRPDPERDEHEEQQELAAR